MPATATPPKPFNPLKDPLPPDCLEFTIGKSTYIARQLVRSRCGIDPSTPREWAKDRLIEKPLRLRVRRGGAPQADGTWPPSHRTFYVKEQIDAEQERRDVPPAKLPKPRTPTEIRKLDDDDFVTIAEMESVGVPRSYVERFWDWQHPRRTRGAIPSPVMGRQFQTKPGEQPFRDRSTGRTYLMPVPLVRWGDVRELLQKRDNPPLPEGGILVRDAVAKLKAIGIRVSYSQLGNLVRARAIDGGEVDGHRPPHHRRPGVHRRRALRQGPAPVRVLRQPAPESKGRRHATR